MARGVAPPSDPPMHLVRDSPRNPFSEGFSVALGGEGVHGGELDQAYRERAVVFELVKLALFVVLGC